MKKEAIPIIYEDSDVLAINKPAGLAVHHDGRLTEETVVDWVKENYPELEKVGESMLTTDGRVIERPGIVHRLDRDTSGVLVIAKNQPAFLYIKEQFKNRDLEKTYRAIVCGKLTLEAGETIGRINVSIGRSRRDPRLRVALPAGRIAQGKRREALTLYKILANYRDYSYVEAYPKTGRTHQLRVHFKYLNHPIACDSLYAPKQPCPVGLSRLALHAYSLELTLPAGGRIKFSAELPADFQTALDNLKSLC